MKGRISSDIWKWAGGNAAALMAVLLLAYAAGSRSGGLGIQDFGALPQVAGFELLGALFLVVAVTVALLIQLSSRVLRPVEQLTEFSDRIAQGDYSARVEISGNSDFSVIAENCSGMVAVAERADSAESSQKELERSFTELIEVVGEVGQGDLYTRAHVLADASAELAEGLNRMLESLVRTVDRVHDCGSEVTGNGRQGLSVAESVAGSAVRAQQEIAACTAGLEKFTLALRETGVAGENSVVATRRALQVAEDCGQALQDASGNAQRIRGAMKSTAEHIQSLGERSLQVYEVINLINETHLLALNAAIEASRAAQSGNGLEVLDTELRKMGEHSRKATKSVVTLLQSIHSEANEAAAVVEQANRLAESGAHGMEQATGVYTQATSALQEAAARSEAVTEGCRDRLQEVQSMAVPLQNATRVARQGTDSAQKAVSAMEQLVRSTMQLHEALSRLRTTPALRAEALAAEIAAAAGAGGGISLL